MDATTLAQKRAILLWDTHFDPRQEALPKRNNDDDP